MSFRVPGSSSPPSTPGPSRRSNLTAHPSTTPLGPPPSSLTGFSTTPAGNPPASSFFGAESNGSSVPFPTFGSTNNNPLNGSPLRQQMRSHFHDDEDGDFDVMDEDEETGRDLVTYTQNFNDDLIPTGESLNLQEIAKGLAPAVHDRSGETDRLVLMTEHVLDTLSRDIDRVPSSKDQLLSSATQSLIEVWKESYPLRPSETGIGPSADAAPPKKAFFLASLLLKLHHPPDQKRSSRGSGFLRRQTDTMPKVLLDWLHENHFPFQGELEEVISFEPNPASHERFWDVLYNTTLRGDLRDTCELLHSADLGQAATAIDDGAPEYGYRGKQLSNGRRVMQRAAEVIESCPALQSGEWNVKGPEWTMFRRRVQQANADLVAFAEGNNADRYDDADSNFEASHFGMSTPASKNLSLTQRSRQVESKVPWSVYQNLQYLYGQLLGTPTEVIAASGDWVEAALGMVIWWNGDDDDVSQEPMNKSRRLSRSMQQDRLVDKQPQLAYLRKISSVLEDLQAGVQGVDDPELQIDPTDAVQVGLGCVMVGELEGLVRILRGWSPTIAIAIIEIADAGHWLGRAKPSQDLLGGFNQSDLMVLSYAQQRDSATDHDTALSEYAELLGRESDFRDGDSEKQGWQIAVEVLGRLHNADTAAKKIGESLDRLEITDSKQVDQTIMLCRRMGLVSHARKIAMRYGDHLTETTHLYGEAIYHYIRAGSTNKIKELLELLISLSLVQSMSYPPEADLDDSMRNLVSTPRQTLAKLAVFDTDMQERLLRHISGYATLRRFYELRDQDVSPPSNTTPPLRPIARKKEALSSLISLVLSASDSIHGGLFDDSVDSSVSPDVLLVLLGEALPFIDHPDSLLTHEQTLAILKAVEDISTVSPALYNQAEECLKAAIASANGDAPPSPRSALRKSIDLNASTQFSLAGSEFLRQSRHQSSDGSGVLVKGPVKRAWDWRKGLERETKGEKVLTMLRLGLAREMSRTWLRAGVGPV